VRLTAETAREVAGGDGACGRAAPAREVERRRRVRSSGDGA
jgi:hypothetical protein